MSGRYRIIFTPKAAAMLEAVRDRRERELLPRRIEELAEAPELQGKALLGELRGHRSVRAVGQRYRVIYRVLREEILGAGGWRGAAQAGRQARRVRAA